MNTREAYEARKRARRLAYEAQAKSWRDVLPEDVRKWATATLNKASKDEACVDNYRVARMNSTSQMRRYRKQKERGCCGSHDFKAVGPDGNRYLMGFNYGH